MAAARAVTGAGGDARASRASRVTGVPRATGVPGVTGAPWGGGGAVARTTGKVFFTLDGTDYVCSGSVVASANQDVVLTAAHCVCDGAGHWAAHWTFVPGYADGRAPYGSYPARAFFVPAQWTDDADEADDIAFVAVGTARVDGARRHVAAVVGGQRIGFGRRGGTEAVFGYPQEPPYHGRVLEYCDGPLRPDPYGLADAGLACGLTQGGSGAPWLSGFDPATGLGVISGVTAFRYAWDNVTLYSPDLGPVAQALYARASRT